MIRYGIVEFNVLLDTV